MMDETDETDSNSIASTDELLIPVMEKIVLLDNLNISNTEIRNVLSSFDQKLNSICGDSLVKMWKTDDDRLQKRLSEFPAFTKDVGRTINSRSGIRTPSKSKCNKRRSRSAIRPRSVIRPSSLPGRSKSTVRVFSERNNNCIVPEQRGERKTTPVYDSCKPNKRRTTPNENVNITRKSLRSYTKQKNESREDEVIESSFDVSSILSESRPFIQKQANKNNIFSPYAAVRSKTRMSAISTPTKH